MQIVLPWTFAQAAPVGRLRLRVMPIEPPKASRIVFRRKQDEAVEPENLPNFGNEHDLLPAIAQDAQSGRVLMLGWMNRTAFDETVRTKRAVYFSRSRQRLWQKGETSGHVQEVQQILIDCDGDTILLKVRQQGAACHQGYASCFFRRLVPSPSQQLDWVVTERPQFDPQAVYSRPTNTKTEE